MIPYPRGPKAPTDLDDKEAWERYDRAWFWYTVRWWTWLTCMALLLGAELVAIYVMVMQ